MGNVFLSIIMHIRNEMRKKEFLELKDFKENLVNIFKVNKNYFIKKNLTIV